MPPWFEYMAVAVCAVSGVLAAEGKGMDLFGALVLALVTAVGGGTLRDLCLGIRPVFWIQNPAHITTALIAAGATFVMVRFVAVPNRALMIADAFGLALFGIVGAERALSHGSPAIIAIMLGVVTGVAGGILRDVLRGEVPWVFREEIDLYATAVFFGALVYVVLKDVLPDSPIPRYSGMLVILLLRLAAMRWRLRLPVFRSRERSTHL